MSTRVRLIDGEELADWLEGLREEEEGAPDSVERKDRRGRLRRRRR
jgi:hypothetical protein